MLPPFGTIADNFSDFFTDKHMGDWNLSLQEWRDTYADILDVLREKVHPTWDEKNLQWVGTAANTMEQVTKAELETMIRVYQQAGILQAMPSYQADVDGLYLQNHQWHYEIEDNMVYTPARPWRPDEKVSPFAQIASFESGTNFVSYAPQYNPERFHRYFFTEVARKIHGLFDFKRDFRRPRPYQAAALLGVNDFRYQFAATAIHTGNHPSMLSGHCVQGILLGCKVLEHWLDLGEDNPDLRERLAQYMVDFGDRRVFAGVHYPSDNIVSWYIALRVIPNTFRHQDQILAFARDAITNKSTVYNTIATEYANNPDLQHLHQFIAPIVTPPQA